MAEAEEGITGEAGAGRDRVHFSEHLDIAIVMLVLIALFVHAFGAVGRHVGNRSGRPGVTAFFGG